MTEFETTSFIVAGVGVGGIWRGIRAMVCPNKDRAGILDRQHEAGVIWRVRARGPVGVPLAPAHP